MVEVMLPPVMPTALEFCAARLPRPDTEELGIGFARLRVVMLAVVMLAVTREEVVKMAWVPVTFCRLRKVMVEVVMVVEAKVFLPVKLLVPERVARFATSERLAEDKPLIVAPVTLSTPVTARLVEVAEVKVELVKLVLVVKVIAPLLKVMSGVPVTELAPL